MSMITFMISGEIQDCLYSGHLGGKFSIDTPIWDTVFDTLLFSNQDDRVDIILKTAQLNYPAFKWSAEDNFITFIP